ncbi:MULTISPECIES: LemA family protein [Chryseobacterium]|uniref:LemA family n=1 Tax=Chryseobacterium indoltheticum TaxID=254 RepID=A0A381FNQ5_9FLAO|nr:MULTISPECIES: LemA family protein [Chryseobacterium]AZA75468.1 LemA family protein [Chryseobacterium indoltheticum]MDQ8143064.1 LemA family protein [Chryseobacterium sp. CFS15]QQQ27792.1 LemA family protein [Chryseobacterium indoltheticum]REC41634.1 LemA family protein [Chryseobacterium sp. 5_R23647]SIQ66553.1 LemA protein [Chryseobacterium indoltheticum]
MIALIVIGVLVLAVLYGVSIYNRLVKLRNLVQEAWSSIDVMLKKRHDLIPNLVETVKGYATHERETLENVTRARNLAVGADSVEGKEIAEKNLNQAMVNLFAVAEQYPDLKANANFQQLQAELSSIENDIEKSRRYYNGTVRENNTLVESFPSNIVANMYKFEKSKFFELDNIAEREVPNVKF